MGSVCRCRCLLSGWATLLLSCSFKWGRGDETQPGSCWRGIIPSGAEFKRWKSEFEGWGHLFIHDGIKESAEIGLNQREILRLTVQSHMNPECCWSISLLLKHRDHMHHKETWRRSKEGSTHQRSERQQQQRSPNTWSLHYPASHLLYSLLFGFSAPLTEADSSSSSCSSLQPAAVAELGKCSWGRRAERDPLRLIQESELWTCFLERFLLECGDFAPSLRERRKKREEWGREERKREKRNKRERGG